MKPPQVGKVIPQIQPAQPATPPNEQYATVYTFVIWDHDRAAAVIYPRMATRETIIKMRGKINEDTAWVVENSALDADGFYSGTAPSSR